MAGRGAFAGDINFPHQLHMRVVRAAHAHGRIVALDTAAARAFSGVVCGVDRGRFAEVPPIDFREGSIPALDPYRQPVLATRSRALCRRTDRRGVCRRSLFAEDAADWSRRKSRICRRCSMRQPRRSNFRRTHSSEAADHPPGLWRRRRGVPRAPHVVELDLRLAGTPAFRCKPRRHHATMRGATSRTPWRRQGAAPHR